MPQKAKRLGDIITVENKERKFGALTEYMYFRLQDEQGNETAYLASEHDLRVMRERAEKNEEDLLKVSFIRDLFD